MVQLNTSQGSSLRSQAQSPPIRVGDTFKTPSGFVEEVIRVLPGGKIDLFDRERCRFHMRYHRDVKTWERA